LSVSQSPEQFGELFVRRERQKQQAAVDMFRVVVPQLHTK